MLRQILKAGDLTRRSERNAVLTRTLFEAFKDRHKEYTNLRILAANEDTLVFTKYLSLKNNREYIRIATGYLQAPLHPA